MKEKIGETAGKVWDVLSKKKELSLSQIPKAVKETDALVYQALGWLAREDKIQYLTKGNRTIVKLS